MLRHTRSLLALLPPRPRLHLFAKDDTWVIVSPQLAVSDSQSTIRSCIPPTPHVLPEFALPPPDLSLPELTPQPDQVFDATEESLRVLDAYLDDIQRAATQLQASQRDDHLEHIQMLQARVALLEQDNAALRTENAQLRARGTQNALEQHPSASRSSLVLQPISASTQNQLKPPPPRPSPKHKLLALKRTTRSNVSEPSPNKPKSKSRINPFGPRCARVIPPLDETSKAAVWRAEIARIRVGGKENTL
ncbi:hypothetical protein HMN09_01422700 [Mycena chlorophos]|uniref:Uncharacterized protein n=1 Tax=Mycena chlorophos TaxID=658473 RepID=A0A8H6RXL9_MYCCL|nr:hypothetical protein HMN09_01422700 [Mycena chlorophos]